MSTHFETFSFQHFAILFVLGTLTLQAVRKGLRAEETLKFNIALSLAGITFSALIIETVVKLFAGTYDILTDLPLFLCDLVTVMLPFVILKRNRRWIGILYFWAMAGTLQALITPELEEGFPSFYFFRYFIMHAGIVAAVLYTVIVWKFRMTWRDLVNAVIYAQVYLVVVHFINQALNSNYSYTLQKPVDPTILDHLGPWPWYIFWGEFIMLVLFILLLLPFLFSKASAIQGPGNESTFGQE